MAGKEHKEAVVLLHAAVGQLVMEGGQYAGAGGLFVGQCHDVFGRKAKFLNQGLADGLGIAGRILQLGPFGIVVNTDDDGPRVAVAGAGGDRRASWQGCRATLGNGEAFAIPAGKLVAIGYEPIQYGGQRFDCALVDVVEQHNAAAFLFDGAQYAIRDRAGHRVGPIQRVDVPHHRAQAGCVQHGESFVIARTVGKAKQR